MRNLCRYDNALKLLLKASKTEWMEKRVFSQEYIFTISLIAKLLQLILYNSLFPLFSHFFLVSAFRVKLKRFYSPWLQQCYLIRYLFEKKIVLFGKTKARLLQHSQSIALLLRTRYSDGKAVGCCPFSSDCSIRFRGLLQATRQLCVIGTKGESANESLHPRTQLHRVAN